MEEQHDKDPDEAIQPFEFLKNNKKKKNLKYQIEFDSFGQKNK